MKSLNEYYRENPQQDGHVDIIFVSNFAKDYVHFDCLIFYKNDIISIDHGGCGWGMDGTYSLQRISAVKYILADDKKIERKSYAPFTDKRLRREDYHHRQELCSFGDIYKVRPVLLTCNESEINLTANIPCLYVNRVAVWCPAYLCPKTGILWDYLDDADREVAFSERFWLFKQLPKTRVIPGKYGGLETKREAKVKTLHYESGTSDPEIFFSPTKTAFLSGKDLILKRLGRNKWDCFRTQIKDPRDFLLKQPKPPKFAVIKSAARYLKKRLRISPLRPSEKKFFQMMGALAHINNETLSRKKAYAA